MRKYFLLSLFLFSSVLIAHPVYAIDVSVGEGTRSGGVGQAIRIAERKGTKASLFGATVLSKTEAALSVRGQDGKEYTVEVDAKTQWRRKFWGKSGLDEVSANDVVNVHGKWIDDAKTQIQALLVRNLSVQKRNGVFFGTVKSLSPNGWVMSTVKRGDQAVTISGSSRLIDRKEGALSQSAITVGHRVRVRGLWDSKNSTISEVTEVKDFDLPAKLTTTP